MFEDLGRIRPGVPGRETRIPSTAHWRLAAIQDEMRKAGMQEGRNKSDAAGVSLRLLLSCLPAFLNSFPGEACPHDVRAQGVMRTEF
jgi:hypothetical protein